jgi:hypothetical protein
MSRDAIVPEEWVEAAYKAGWANRFQSFTEHERDRISLLYALKAVVPLAEQRATRSLMKAREETEGR